MTDTAAREEAVERVRAWLDGLGSDAIDDAVITQPLFDTDLAPSLGDLRLLLSGGEGWRLDAEPRLHVEASARGARPAGHCESDAAWEEFVAQYKGQPRSYAKLSDFALANAVFMADRNSLDLIHYQTAAKERIRWLSIRLAEALTDPRQPSEAPVTADEKLMSRDREAIAEILFGLKCPELAQHFTYAAFREKTGPVPGVESALAALIALPVGGGVEVDLMMAERALDRWYQTQPRTGPNVSRDRHDMMEALRAALSPRSADGLCSLAAKDGAAAPPQAPVAGSEDSAADQIFADAAAHGAGFGMVGSDGTVRHLDLSAVYKPAPSLTDEDLAHIAWDAYDAECPKWEQPSLAGMEAAAKAVREALAALAEATTGTATGASRAGEACEQASSSKPREES